MKNYTQLQPFHFYREDKPKKEDFIETQFAGSESPGIERFFNEQKYEKSLQEWERKYVEPQYDWVSFEDEKPEKNNVWVKSESSGIRATKRCPHDWNTTNEYYSDRVGMINWTHWADKETHDAKLAYYNYHKVLFNGWKKEEVSLTDEISFERDGAIVYFTKREEGYSCSEIQIIDKAVYRGEYASIELFKLMLKENNI